MLEQREFGKGDRKGRAKKAAAKRDRMKMAGRYQANAGVQGISQEQAMQAMKADIAETGVKASKSTNQLAAPVKLPGDTPKHAEPKPGGNALKQIETQSSVAKNPVQQAVTSTPGVSKNPVQQAKSTVPGKTSGPKMIGGPAKEVSNLVSPTTNLKSQGALVRSSMRETASVAKNPAQTIKRAASKGKGLFGKALNAAKSNPKTSAAIGAGVLATGVGTGMVMRKRRQNN